MRRRLAAPAERWPLCGSRDASQGREHSVGAAQAARAATICSPLVFDAGPHLDCSATAKRKLTRLQSGLIAYLDSVKSRDPAARSRWDVLFYPGVWALGFHRPRALAVGGTALLAGAPGQPFRAVPDRDRHPSRRQDRRALLPRPRLQRDRRDRRDRRRRHHLPARDARRHQSDDGRRRQAPPDASHTAW